VLVTFYTKAFSNITMFGEVAIELLKMMGHSGTVPSAIEPEDIPEALRRLNSAVARDEEATVDKEEEHDESEEDRVSLRNRALPLIELLEAAEKDNVPVMWDE
jgi:hypothetical protein